MAFYQRGTVQERALEEKSLGLRWIEKGYLCVETPQVSSRTGYSIDGMEHLVYLSRLYAASPCITCNVSSSADAFFSVDGVQRSR